MNNLLRRKISVGNLLLCIGISLLFSFTLTWAAQPHMQSALTALRNARRDLIDATADKRGHRANAIKLTDQAIAEVQAGMESN
ncbi:MAG TPA: hypothetical protein VGL72_08835 [Bryobacteraceae bacterium]|jgi:hypothetical protein